MSFPFFNRRKQGRADAVIAVNAAVRSSDTKRIKKLISQYPDLLETSDEKGRSPLHWAAEVQSLASVACLIDLGADPTRKDNLGFTPEQLASWQGEYRMGAYTDVCQRIATRLKMAPNVPEA